MVCPGLPPIRDTICLAEEVQEHKEDGNCRAGGDPCLPPQRGQYGVKLVHLSGEAEQEDEGALLQVA